MNFNVRFHNGPFLEYVGSPNDPIVKVDFIDTKTGTIVYSSNIGPGHWASANPPYYIKWKISVSYNEQIIYEHSFDVKNKRVLIDFPYLTIGDFLLWMPVFERFRVENDCKLIVFVRTVKYIDIVHKSFPDIIFTTNIEAMINEGLYATYSPNLAEYDKYFCPTYPKYQTAQQAATEFLGMDYHWLNPKVDSNDNRPNIGGKYICIAEHGRSNVEKQWLYPNGYQTVADYLVKKGWIVASVSYEAAKIKGNNIVDASGTSLKEMIQYIKYSDLTLGGATGVLIVSRALGIPTIQISTNTWPDESDASGAIYLYNHTPGTCFGCYTQEPKATFKSCSNPMISSIPECSMNITPNMVIDKINEILKIS